MKEYVRIAITPEARRLLRKIAAEEDEELCMVVERIARAELYRLVSKAEIIREDGKDEAGKTRRRASTTA